MKVVGWRRGGHREVGRGRERIRKGGTREDGQMEEEEEEEGEEEAEEG